MSSHFLQTGVFLVIAVISTVICQTCNPASCVLPHCRCYDDKNPPGNLPISSVPQIIAVTMTDSLSATNVAQYQDLFDEVLNPNGCPIRGTFFVQMDNTDLAIVRSLWLQGHEIGITAKDGNTPVSSTDWINMLRDSKRSLAQIGIDPKEVLGVRSPQMALDGSDEYIGIGVNNMLYDSSCTQAQMSTNDTYIWPFTYDNIPGPQCDSGEVPDKIFPGKWQVPVASLHDLSPDMTPCAIPSACRGINSTQTAFDLFLEAFNGHYRGSRTPFMLVADPAWVVNKQMRDGTVEFLQYVRAAFENDVWIVPVSHALAPTFARAPWPQQTIAAEGGNLTLHCNPEAAPQPVLEWSRNGQSLISGAGGAGVEVLIDGTLVVSGLTLSDQGRYECIATNLLGEARASTEVVIATGLRFLQTPIDTEGTVNTTLFLYCEASFHRQLFDMSYIWKFNGRIIDTERGHFYKKGSSNHLNGLYIVNAQYQHTGTYECIATTVMSSISASAIVHVKGPPGEPAGVYTDRRAPTDSMSASVVWIWNSAHNHGYPVTFFIIESHTEFRQEWTVLVSDIPESQTLVPDSPEPMRRRFVVGNLLPNNNYRFRVRAVNQAGVGLPSRPSDQYHVPAACPVTAPSDVSGGGGSVGTLTITWTALNMEEVGGDQFGYIVYWRLADDKTAFNQEDVGNVTSYTVTVGVDNYFLLYHVKVQPYNILGLGPVSEVAEVYSAEGMPVVRPTNVRSYDYNSTAALITWDTVTDDRETVKGRVRGYRVDYYSLRDTDGQNGSLNVHCQCGEAIIVGLTPGGYYNVRVSVFNMAGLSTQSESYLVAVLDPAPGLAPQFVAVVGNGPNSVKVTWRGVVQQFGEPSLLKYKVMWWQVGDDIRMAESTTIRMPATTAVIRGLQSDVIYKLRVLAVNIGGEGQKSPSVLFTLTQGRTLHVHPSTFDPATSEILLSSATSTSGCVCILTVSLILAFLSDIQQKS